MTTLEELRQGLATAEPPSDTSFHWKSGYNVSQLRLKDAMHRVMEDFWQVVNGMRHRIVGSYYEDMSPSGIRTYLDEKCAPDCEKCALERIGGKRP